MNSKLTIGGAVVLGLLAMASPALAQSCSGVWRNGQKTTLKFNGESKVQYCFKSECFNESFVGVKNGELQFPVGTRGAFIILNKTRKGYKAIYRYGNISSRAKYKCK